MLNFFLTKLSAPSHANKYLEEITSVSFVTLFMTVNSLLFSVATRLLKELPSLNVMFLYDSACSLRVLSKFGWLNPTVSEYPFGVE